MPVSVTPGMGSVFVNMLRNGRGGNTHARRSAMLTVTAGLPRFGDAFPFAKKLSARPSRAVIGHATPMNGCVAGHEKSEVDVTCPLESDADALLRVSGRSSEVLPDRSRREALQVVEAKYFSVTRREPREHFFEEKCMFDSIGASVRDLFRCIDRYLDALNSRTLTPVVTTDVAHRRSEPRPRVVNPCVLREECQPCFLHERLGIGYRHVELPNGDGEEQSPIVTIHPLRIGVPGGVDFLDGERR